MANKSNSVLYVGMTNDIFRRADEHKTKRNPSSFSAQYNCSKLVYVEVFSSPYEAILREKQIKAGSRRKKNMLIWKENPKMVDILDKLRLGQEQG